MFKGLVNRYKLVKDSIKNPGKGNSSTYTKYPPDFVFTDRTLNLGCGTTVYKGNVVNLDIFPGEGIDTVWDLSKTPLPFKDNEFDLIIANHILEHIPNWWECFKELARIVKVGGIIEVWLPGDGTSGQLGYRDHLNVINYCSFAGVRGTFRNYANSWEIEQRKLNGEIDNLSYASAIIFKPVNYWWIHIWPTKFQLWMMTVLRNVTQEQCYKFVKLEGDKDA